MYKVHNVPPPLPAWGGYGGGWGYLHAHLCRDLYPARGLCFVLHPNLHPNTVTDPRAPAPTATTPQIGEKSDQDLADFCAGKEMCVLGIYPHKGDPAFPTFTEVAKKYRGHLHFGVRCVVYVGPGVTVQSQRVERESVGGE